MLYFQNILKHMKQIARPWHVPTRWYLLGGVAVVGSLFYGASLAAVIAGWDLARGAAWLTLSAGTGWLLFGPILAMVTRRPLAVLADACLVAMACGEAVLAVGAVANFSFPRGAVPPVPFNLAVVGLSNIVMAAVMVRRLGREGVPASQVLGCWLLVLDGGGAVAFWLFYHLLFGGVA